MKVILETANELLEAFDNLPNDEKQHFLLVLYLNNNKTKSITQKDDGINPLDFFGLWQGQEIDTKKLRSDAWNNRI